ncbi:MAG TPA: hypothetical protein VGN42_25920 [Pirellulales bacterium]|nr:hypothetical protein [Pirellulales bacterium]
MRSIEKHAALSMVLLGAALLGGCGGPPQVASGNQRLISALRTATSAQQVPWLDECAKQVDEGKAAGTISADEAAAFEAIIALARSGEWKQAEDEAARLGAAQRPTAEDIERLKSPEGRKPRK